MSLSDLHPALVGLTPEDLLSIKRAMMHAKVADKWEYYNTSAHATLHRIRYSEGTLVRFTPTEYESRGKKVSPYVGYPVVRVRDRRRPRVLTRHDFTEYDGEESWLIDDEDKVEQRIALSKKAAEEYDAGAKFVWYVGSRYYRTATGESMKGYATSVDEACACADEWLMDQGWVLT